MPQAVCLLGELVKFASISDIGLWLPVAIVISLFIGVAGSSLAKRKNRDRIIWFIICLFCGLLGLLPLACADTLVCDEETGFQESDSLSVVMFVLTLVWAGVAVWCVTR